MDPVTVPVPTNRVFPPRKVTRLPPIQTSFAASSNQRIRPPNPSEVIPAEPSTKFVNVTTESPTLRHRNPRGGLSALFRRKKVEKNLEIFKDLEAFAEGARVTPTPASKDAQLPRNGARLSFGQEITATAPESIASEGQSPKPGARSKSLKRELTIRTPTTWDPPPLFQAYPQAVKHASLRAPMVSTDAILRARGGPNNTNKGQKDIHTTVDSKPVKANIDVGKRKGYSRRKFKHTLAEPIPKDCWTRKLYVLVTSGYFLQYAGEGNFDRLPEKIMALSKNSAAFASDVISGEHWVLQISQSPEIDSVRSYRDRGSMMKKIGFPRDAKRSASSFLLTLDSPEEMDSWLKVVRGEIESMGGQKYRPDVGACMESALTREHEKLSHRYSIRSPEASFGNTAKGDGGSKLIARQSPTSTVRRRSMASQMSADSPVLSNATVSINQTYLDQLRSSRRMSYASTGGKTLSTSRGSSPGTSPRPVPVKSNFPFRDYTPILSEGDVLVPKIPNTRRALAQNSSRKSFDPSSASRSTSRSASRSPGPLSTNRSHAGQSTPPPPAQNFSVPTFSKRNSMVTRVPLSPTSETSRSSTKDLGSSLTLSSPESKFYTEAEEIKLSLPHSSSSCELSSIPPKKDRPLPRRLSSLQYSRGISPRHLSASQLLLPRPPPSTALPAVPGHLLVADQTHIEDHQSQNRALRRPLSMQVRSDPIGQVHHQQAQGTGINKSRSDRSPKLSSEASHRTYHFSSLLPSQPSRTLNRRSMPELEIRAHFPSTSRPPLPNLSHDPRTTLTKGG